MRTIATLALLFALAPFVALAAGPAYTNAATFAGADASIKINGCILAVIAAGGGTCDATALSGSQSMSQPIALGSAAQTAAHVHVTLLLPTTAMWTWTLPPDPKACALTQWGSTSLIGSGVGGGGNRMVMQVQAGSSLDSIYCTADAENYVLAQGFAVWNKQPSTFKNGTIHIRGVVDESAFERIFSVNYYGDVWHIEGACCGARFANIQGISDGAMSGKHGGTPLSVGPGKVVSIQFYDLTANAPGIGHHDVVVTGGAYIKAVSFFGLYMEGNGRVDPTTSMVYIDSTVGPVNFFGGDGNTEQPLPVVGTKAIFESRGVQLNVQGFDSANTSLGIIDKSAKGGTVTIPTYLYSGNLGTIPAYTTPH